MDGLPEYDERLENVSSLHFIVSRARSSSFKAVASGAASSPILLRYRSGRCEE